MSEHPRNWDGVTIQPRSGPYATPLNSTVTVVTVYTAGPSCMACTLTKRHLDRRGISYTEVPISSDTNIFEAIDALGFTTAPVVCVATDGDEQLWDGYRPDRIDGITRA